KVLVAERYSWAATRGVQEGWLLENLPEDLQRDIRRHLFKFVKKRENGKHRSRWYCSSLSEEMSVAEELLTWCLEHSSVSEDAKKIKFPGQRLVSSRTVRCLTNAAFGTQSWDRREGTWS
ncbi:hypothetical protein Tsubulata_045871, partial [Turnera subulata]